MRPIFHIFTFVFAIAVASVACADEVPANRCTAMSCVEPSLHIPVQCELIAVHFSQPEPGPVLYEIWVGEELALSHVREKGERDAYRTCRSLIERATRVVLCSQTAGGRVLASSDPLADFLGSDQYPVDLTGRTGLGLTRRD